MSPKELVEQYIADVQSGRRVAGKLEKAMIARHLKDLEDAGDRGFYFDEELAERGCNFFPLLVHSTGEYDGKPFELKGWQAFIVWCICGWRRIVDGMRRFRFAFISVGRGNGKSPFAAGLCLLLFGFDYPIEARAECYCAATKLEQSKIVFREIKRFVSKRPQLKSIIRVLKAQIQVPHNDSTLIPLGQDSENTDGLIPHCIIVDELHAWRERHRELWDKLETAMAKRRQPLMVIITTAGSDKSELWEEQYSLSCEVVDPDCAMTQDDRFVAIFQIDADDNPFDEEVWPKANPMLEHGVVKIDAIRTMANQARINPDSKNRLLRYYCNTRVSSSTKLIPRELWATGNGELPDLTDMSCHGGFDWGWKRDLTGLALVFPLEPIEVDGMWRRRYALHVDAWIPEGCPYDLTREPWATFIARNELRVTKGNTTDTQAIYMRMQELREIYGIKTIAIDGNNAREFGSRVENEFGITPYSFGQTEGKYNEPLRELMVALEQGRIVHGGNNLLAWCADNVVSSEDSRGYIKPNKHLSKKKIDPFCAVVMGLSECLFADSEVASFYDDNEVEVG